MDFGIERTSYPTHTTLCTVTVSHIMQSADCAIENPEQIAPAGSSFEILQIARSNGLFDLL